MALVHVPQILIRLVEMVLLGKGREPPDGLLKFSKLKEIFSVLGQNFAG